MTEKVRYRIGDIIAIPLETEMYAFARVYRDATIAIFDLVADRFLSAQDICTRHISFFAAFFDDAIIDGTWPLIGHYSFEDEEAAWPPPRMVRDVIDPTRFRIYHRGKIRPASQEEVANLDPVLMYRPNQLVDRIKEVLAGSQR